LVTDHERVAVEDLDLVAAHEPAPATARGCDDCGGPGNARWRSSNSSASPSNVSSLRSIAVIAFASPRDTASKSALEPYTRALTSSSESRKTSISPFFTRTNQVSVS